MALSTRAKLAGLGGALALGVLGVGGYAYAETTTAGTGTSYVTTVDDGSAGVAGTAPGQQDRSGSRADCPEKDGSGAGGTGSAPATPSAPAESGSTDGAADA